ncbi:MAG: selenocysteine-specific translation elongation factor, partial [Dehalococcoidia bacterium]|nr:selenocysteine-specific translation elongation factor [Dehalococcoidia bacterium]
MFVVGTAGHVDHGKSTLVQVLTGMDPDRLREEKDRGMTIELGFAWLKLASGIEISIVDVPGHERFIKNMLMGSGGVDAALLLIAADEGPMPQTREHLAILDLLCINTGLVIITKKDLVDQEWLDLVILDVEEMLKNTSLTNAQVLAVSAERGDGIDELKIALDVLISQLPTPSNTGAARLPVDRSFSITGFGAVVTGTLAGGSLKTSQEVEILPSGDKARIRSLQVHEKSQENVEPGNRLAVNLSGIDHVDVKRGDLITTTGWLKPSTAFDGFLQVIKEAPRPVRHNHKVLLFTGTRETPATIRILEGSHIDPGTSGWIQIKTQEQIPIIRGEYFIVRDTENTLGGGRILETNASRRKRNDPTTISRLQTLASGSNEDIKFNALVDIEPATIVELASATGSTHKEVVAAIATLESQGRILIIGTDPKYFVSIDGWERLENTAIQLLSTFHSSYPLRRGMPLQDFRGRLKLNSLPFNAIVDSLIKLEKISTSDSTIRLIGHIASLSPDQEMKALKYLKEITNDRFSPSTLQGIDIELLQFLSERGEVVRVGEE